MKHRNPTCGYFAVAGQVFFCPQFFLCQFATLFLSAVRLGRRALWLVLVVCVLFVRPANVLDYEAWLFTSFFAFFFKEIIAKINPRFF